MHLRKWIYITGFIGALSAYCGFVLAQERMASEPVLEEVIVTAQKRVENAQSVPISMNVFQPEQLEHFNITDFQSLQTAVPGMVVHTSPVNSSIYLRGFGSATGNPVLDQSVSIYQDGIYLGLGRQSMDPFFDVARMEVLRGPQGALVGKNTAAGAINIVTADPTPELTGAATASYNFDRTGVESSAFVAGPITDQLGARLAVKYSNLDGYLHNVGTGETEPREKLAFARGTLSYHRSSRFDIETKFEYGHSTSRGSSSEIISATVYQNLTNTKNAADGFGVPPYDGEYSDNHLYNSATVANLNLGDFTLRSITGFSGFKAVKNSFAAPLDPEHFDILWTDTFNQQSEELMLLSPTGRTVDYIVGVYGDGSDHKVSQAERYDVFGGLFNGAEHSEFSQSSRSASAFVSATWHTTENARLLGSLRYTHIRKSANFALIDDFESGVVPDLIGVPFALRQTISENDVDPSITAQFDLSRDAMVYATFAKGSKGGGFDPSNNKATVANFSFKPEHSTNYEIGVKSSSPSHRVVFDVSAFILRFNNLQVSGYNPTTVSLSTTNAATATSKGIEATLAWQALDHLRFSGSGALTDAAYDNFPGAPCTANEPSTCTAATNNIKGYPLQFVPKWSAQLQADYSAPLTSGLVLDVIAAPNYRSSIWVDDGNYNPIIGLQRAALKFDARIQIGSAKKDWDVALVGKNLTNVFTRSYAYAWALEPAPGGVPAAVAIVEETRTVALQATVHF